MEKFLVSAVCCMDVEAENREDAIEKFFATCPLEIYDVRGVYRPVERDVFEYEKVFE